MKTNYGSLKCPRCGSKKFEISEDDVFVCDYCGEKFNFDFNENDIDENTVEIQELKEKFNAKITELYGKKRELNAKLQYCRKLAYPTALSTVAGICIALSVIFFFGSLSLGSAYMISAIIAAAVSTAVFVLAKIRAKIRHNKYYPLLSYYAKQIVVCEDKLDLYISIVSRLTK